MDSHVSHVVLVGEMTPGSYGHCFRLALSDWGLPTTVISASSLPPTAWLRDPPWSYASRAAARVVAQARARTIGWGLRRVVRQRSRLVTLIVGMQRLDHEALHAVASRGPVVLFFNDDLETRRGRSAAWWENARKVLAATDLLVTQRPHRLYAIRAHFAGPIVFQDFAYMEMFHRPTTPAGAVQSCDAGFVGNFDEDRVPFLRALGRAGVKTALWGTRWPARALRQDGVSCRGYLPAWKVANALATSRLGLCLVRQNNFDQHAMRTFEVPACGAFLLAERTPDHQRLFQEGVEAEFFETLEELVDKCRFYVAHDQQRVRIAQAGLRRVRAVPNTVRDRLREALQHPRLALSAHLG